MRVEELVVGADRGKGRTAADLRRSGAVLLALRSGDGALRVGPGDDEILRPDDIVVAMGTRDQLTTLAATLGPGPARR
jgi:K+/H+ antiporter YhaU regulatory subunit KhtT